MIRSLFLTALVMTLTCTALQANSILHVDANEQALVFVNGEEIGTTPITLRNIKPGYYEVSIRHPYTGEMREMNFYSPKSITIEKTLTAEFKNQPIRAGDPAVGLQTYPNEHLPARAFSPVEAPKKDNTKVRMRNVFLGAGLVNEVFNGGGSKKGVRKGVVGAGLLNELLNK